MRSWIWCLAILPMSWQFPNNVFSAYRTPPAISTKSFQMCLKYQKVDEMHPKLWVHPLAPAALLCQGRTIENGANLFLIYDSKVEIKKKKLMKAPHWKGVNGPLINFYLTQHFQWGDLLDFTRSWEEPIRIGHFFCVYHILGHTAHALPLGQWSPNCGSEAGCGPLLAFIQPLGYYSTHC